VSEELARLTEALGPSAVRLEHIGSTSVPGLAAKPILDLLLAVASIESTEVYVDPLGELGYLFAWDPETPDFHFFGKPPERPRSHHLHVCEAGSVHELRHLAVRDFLRAHRDEAAEYAELKRAIAARHPNDRLAYVEGKGDYMTDLEARAVAWALSGQRRPGLLHAVEERLEARQQAVDVVQQPRARLIDRGAASPATQVHGSDPEHAARLDLLELVDLQLPFVEHLLHVRHPVRETCAPAVHVAAEDAGRRMDLHVRVDPSRVECVLAAVPAGEALANALLDVRRDHLLV
jgi:GrpB-like predicted nucleotidyltransferase (UPF0157 family)